jgi:hypothetical protein
VNFASSELEVNTFIPIKFAAGKFSTLTRFKNWPRDKHFLQHRPQEDSRSGLQLTVVKPLQKKVPDVELCTETSIRKKCMNVRALPLQARVARFFLVQYIYQNGEK